MEENDEITPWLKEIISKNAGDIQSKFNEVFKSYQMVSIFILTDITKDI